MRRLLPGSAGSRSLHTIAHETDLLGDGQREYTIQGFYQWILSDPGRRQTAIRRVDLIKSNEIHHAFHEALLFHVHGPLGEFSGEEIQIYSAWRIIMERAGNLPPNIMAAQDLTQMTIADVSKINIQNHGPAADRVILIPCSLEPVDPQTLPFMKKRSVVKTLQLPHKLFYLDRAREERLWFARQWNNKPGDLPPDHDYDFTKLTQYGFHNSFGWPLIQPLCFQLESMPQGSAGYKLFSTNCYFFARTIFYALEYAYAGKWEHVTQEQLKKFIHEPPSRLTFQPQKDENLTPLQRTALWLNNTLSGTTDAGELIKRTAREMALGMQNSANYMDIVGFMALDNGADLPQPATVAQSQGQSRIIQSVTAKSSTKVTNKGKGWNKSSGKK